MNVLESPIDYALDIALKQHEGATSDDEWLIYEALKRSKVMWDLLRIHGIETVGMTFDQFCNHANSRRNVLFFSDEEMAAFEKVKKIMAVVSEQ